MNFSVPCACGQMIQVSEGAAGSQRECVCGLMVRVPALTELRLQAGLPPQPPNPTVVIGLLAEEGKLPTLTNCTSCDAPTSDTAIVTVECEIVSSDAPGDSKQGATAAIGFLFVIFGYWVVILQALRRDEPTRMHEGSRIVHCPTRLCRACQARLRGYHSLRSKILMGVAITGVVLAIVWSYWTLLLCAVAVLGWIVEAKLRARSQARIKAALGKEPIYEELLTDFPKAMVIVQE